MSAAGDVISLAGCNDLSCPDPNGFPPAPRLEVLTHSWTAVSLTMATLHLQWSAVTGKIIRIHFGIHNI